MHPTNECEYHIVDHEIMEKGVMIEIRSATQVMRVLLIPIPSVLCARHSLSARLDARHPRQHRQSRLLNTWPKICSPVAPPGEILCVKRPLYDLTVEK